LFSIDEKDIEFRMTHSSGAGGQNVNKTFSAVIATHIPTGIQVRIETERSQYKNKLIAVDLLSAKISELEKNKTHNQRNDNRKSQIGSGNRACEKIRTVRYQDAIVKCEISGKQKLLKNYLKGDIVFD